MGGARTPFCNFQGGLSTLTATDLGTLAANAALQRTQIEPHQIDNVVFGNVMQTHNGAAYLARHIGLKTGVPEEVPALTVNRLCGSGLQAVASAMHDIVNGDSQVALAGGAESMSLAPYLLRGARQGLRMGDATLVDMLNEVLTDCHIGLPMGLTAERLAEKDGITRAEQDAYALLSHQRAWSAKERGRLADEIVPVPVGGRQQVILADEHIRKDTTTDGLANLRPAFMPDGTVTAGNASSINDGAAALVLASESAVMVNGWQPMARIMGTAVCGVSPALMGIGPVPAIKKVLSKTHLAVDDIDLFEVNEAFSAQYLSVERALKLPRDRTNVNGGAIALGHPVGASGARLLLTLAIELKQRQMKRGVAALCIGGGQGIAMVIESVD